MAILAYYAIGKVIGALKLLTVYCGMANPWGIASSRLIEVAVQEGTANQKPIPQQRNEGADLTENCHILSYVNKTSVQTSLFGYTLFQTL